MGIKTLLSMMCEFITIIGRDMEPPLDHIMGTACTYGSNAFSCGTSGYSSGANTLYVECYDAVPNYSTGHSITITYNPPENTSVLGPGTVLTGGVVR